MTAATVTTATGEATVLRTIGMMRSVTATESVATTIVSDVAATTMRATTTTASESESANANATGPGRLRSTTEEGDHSEKICT